MEEHGGDRHESEASDLYEQEQDHLAEKGPFRSAASDKTGDTRGRGGRKQRGEQARRASIRGGTGQHQQRRAYGDHQRKAKHYDLHVGQAMPDEFVSFDPHWLDVLALILHIQYTRSMQ